jgi:hypothetical protein
MRTVNLRDSYKFYSSNETEPVKVKTYIEIVLGFIKFMMNKVFEGKDIKLPCELGVIGIRGKRQKPRLDEDGNVIGLPPDWVGTKKLWDENPEAKKKGQLLYLFNEHTAGVRYKVVWFKGGFKFKNKSVYSIRFSRFNKRTISGLIKGGKEYQEGRTSREKGVDNLPLQNRKDTA